ncbi:MAG TPA: hypothetical protein VGK99_20930, partial [Acidobacteriota bacterium]
KMAGAIYRAFLRSDVSRLYDPKFFQTAAAGTNFVAPGPKGQKEIDPAVRPGNVFTAASAEGATLVASGRNFYDQPQTLMVITNTPATSEPLLTA